VYPIIWFLSTVGIGFEAGATSCISRAVGQNDRNRAKRLTTDTAVLATLVSFVLCLIGLATIRPVFSALGATEEVMPLIEDYMSVWYWVEPVATAMWVCLAGIRARGNTLLEGKVITVAALLNAVLDPILIFGWFGFPRLEIQGAAIASLIANAVMLCFTLIYLHTKLRVFANPFTKLSAILDSWRQILRIAVPAALTYATVPISNAIVVRMVADYGLAAVAGFGIAMRIEPIALIFFYSLSAITSPFVGMNFGAGQFDRLLEARRVIAKFCVIFGLVLAGSLDLAAFPLTSPFTASDSIQGVAVEYLWLVSISYGAHGLTMAANSIFNGLGTPMPAVVLTSLRVIFVFLPLAFVGRWLFDLHGIFAASALANIAVGTLAYYWIGHRIRKLTGQTGSASGAAEPAGSVEQ
jgi:putative MATE family efflux protein